MFLLLTLAMYLFAGLDEYIKEDIIRRGFQSGISFVSSVSKWNTQIFLSEKTCGVNSFANLPCSCLENEHSRFQMYACEYSSKFCENLPCD